MLHSVIGPEKARMLPFMPILESLAQYGSLALSAVLLIGGGCANQPKNPDGTPAPSHISPDRPLHPVSWIRTELYFGRVDEESWKTFLESEITPRFPSGLTLLDANGQWRGRDGIVHHVPTRILVILHPDDPATDRALEEIRLGFVHRFHHESVLRSDSRAQVTF